MSAEGEEVLVEYEDNPETNEETKAAPAGTAAQQVKQ